MNADESIRERAHVKKKKKKEKEIKQQNMII